MIMPFPHMNHLPVKEGQHPNYRLKLLAYASFGSLQGVYLNGLFFYFPLDMAGKITRPFSPFKTGLTVCLAIETAWVFNNPVTPLA